MLHILISLGPSGPMYGLQPAPVATPPPDPTAPPSYGAALDRNEYPPPPPVLLLPRVTEPENTAVSKTSVCFFVQDNTS